MSDLKRFKLGDIIEDVAMGPFGSNLKVDNFISIGVPVIRGGNLNQNGFDDKNFVFVSEEKAQSLKRSLAYPDDLVFTHRGTIGQVGIIEKTKYPYYLVSQSQMRLTVNRQFLNPRFLYYWFKSTTGQYELLKNSAQVGVPAIASPTKSLKEIDISIPDLPTQIAIAEILSSLDDKIELNNKINQELENLAQTIFKQWFIDFEFPNDNGEPYKSSGGEMVESELGEIPEGWSFGTLKDEFNLNMGQSPKGETYNETGDGMIFFQGRSDFGFRYPSVRMFTKDPKKVAKKFETLISVRAPVGDINMVEYDCCIGRGLGSISHSRKLFSYTYYKILSIQEELKSYDNEGTVFGSINKETLGNIKTIIPPLTISCGFDDLVKGKDQLIYNLTNQNQQLTTLRDTLLPKLISGELEVSQIKTTS